MGTVHFRKSSQEVLPYSGMSDLQKVVMNAFRQAVVLEHGSSALFMKLPKQQQTLLWESILKADLTNYNTVVKQLLCPNLSTCKSLAVRLHFNGPPHLMVLHPAHPLRDGSGEPATLRHFLHEVMPLLLDSSGALQDGVKLVSQGVVVPLNTPLYWLALHAAYLDHFVHLVAHLPTGFMRDVVAQPEMIP